MKAIIIFSVILLFVCSCSTSSKSTICIIKNDEVEVKICVNTTKVELKNIKSRLLEEKNIIFDFSKTTYTSDFKIDQLDFSVKGPEGYTGHVNAELYMTDEYYGFRRDYIRNAAKPFQCGIIE